MKERAAPEESRPTACEKEIEVEGHLIDSMILTRIFDRIMDLKGDFEVRDFVIGKDKQSTSRARLLIKARDPVHLEQLVEEAYREGGVATAVENVELEPAPADMVMPDRFYSSTNNPTFVHKGGWVAVEDVMMDKCIVYDPASRTARCCAIRDLKAGQLVVVGEHGVKVTPPERPRSGVDIFQFMSGGSSSERPTQHIARKVAMDLHDIRANHGRVVVVSGPAIVHTGASDVLAKLIAMGYVQGLLAGNALAVHDIEHALFGTSLGMYVKDGTLATRGHRNHMQAVNETFKAGSIANMVQNGTLTRGILYECVTHQVPFVLAGSLRDDGPIPDCVADVVEAQRRYKQLLAGADMVLMLCTMLHSIAVGNMLSSRVRVVAVDINQPVVTKLVDRGTWQAVGIVSDVGAFLPMVIEQLQQLRAE